ncbi:sensor domain-containing diguanylate cyclase [Thiohalobacter thiocyanaticus]|uniref:diguanylate cyclase n=1 Tax=Thiohalobacter thiocyanaticus TaxID=585455 RepID=A0A426QM47_9GAMM|nr:GGDEF domain-containing protein [Thiohalobacter thiocyanaticus]RRQ22746.1 GGDEF domain-containing protein [Thiohalobacter thiocyanaticus]
MDRLLESRDYAELRTIINYLGIAAFVIDVENNDHFRLAAINQRHEQLTGMHHAECAGRLVDEVLPPDLAEQVRKNYRRCVRLRSAIDYDETLELPAGTTFWRTTLVPYLDPDGRVFRLLGTAFEITRTVHLEQSTRYQSAILSAYLEESPDGILVVDADNHMRTWNQRFLEIWNLPLEVMESGDGRRALEIVRNQLETPDEFTERILDLYQHLDQEERGYRFAMRDGRMLERYSRGLKDTQGTYWGRIWFYRDVTDHEILTNRLLQLASTDSLTGITNRRIFMETMAEEYRRARRYNHSFTVLMIDLDRFKQVNDRYGHEGGDAALKSFTATIAPMLRETDLFARMGGEEFTILLPETDIEEATQLARRLGQAVAGITVNSHRGAFAITVSIGVSQLQPDDADAEETLSRADRALYTAKEEGRNRVACA